MAKYRHYYPIHDTHEVVVLDSKNLHCWHCEWMVVEVIETPLPNAESEARRQNQNRRAAATAKRLGLS